MHAFQPEFVARFRCRSTAGMYSNLSFMSPVPWCKTSHIVYVQWQIPLSPTLTERLLFQIQVISSACPPLRPWYHLVSHGILFCSSCCFYGTAVRCCETMRFWFIRFLVWFPNLPVPLSRARLRVCRLRRAWSKRGGALTWEERWRRPAWICRIWIFRDRHH